MSESRTDGEVEERRLAAILAADVAGYGRLMGEDEVGTLQALKSLRKTVVDPCIASHRGRLVRTTGDGMLVEFASAVDAVSCAVDIQHGMAQFNESMSAARRIEFRIGINVSDIIGDGGDIYGEGVNVAARLEAMAEPGGICVSRAVRDPVRDKLAFGFQDLGEVTAKNIARPIHAFRVRLQAETTIAELGFAALRKAPRSLIAAAALLAVLGVGAAVWYSPGRTPAVPASSPLAIATPGSGTPSIVAPPRLSLVVLPFENLGGDPADDYLVDGITDDLTKQLSDVPGAFVIARSSAVTYRGKAMYVRRIATELGVRYAVEGSVHRTGAMLRVNAELISTDTGARLWSDRFDEPISDLARGQDAIVARMRQALNIGPSDIEAMRKAGEGATSADAFDLVLRARAELWKPQTPQTLAEAARLYEQAVQRDANSVLALAGAAYTLAEGALRFGAGTRERLDRAAQYLERAQAAAPDTRVVLTARTLLMRADDRWTEWAAAAERLVQAYPNAETGLHQLATVRMLQGRLDEAVALVQASLRLSPRSQAIAACYGRLAYLMVLEGRDTDAIEWSRRALAERNPPASAEFGAHLFLVQAAAYARMGEPDAARRSVAEARRLWPLDTVRAQGPAGRASEEHQAQIRRWQDALRLAGYRDHADPDANFGVPSDDRLHASLIGQTPTTVPGAKTIGTTELVTLLAERKPLVITTMWLNYWYRSIPGAIGLAGSGLGGELSDTEQERLGHRLRELTAGNLSAPIVAVGWNSERFDGRNLALRLVALGYTNVFWYRGGQEAWEVAGLPEAELTAQDW